MSDVPAAAARHPAPGRGEWVLGAGLFAGAVIAVAAFWPSSGLHLADWPQVLLFLLFGVFTISIGYAHPVFGYVSFDRVAQVSSLLVLGPVDAAWINGLASLIYPWHRLRKGVPLPAVIGAALTNAGLMTLMLLAGGSLYLALEGPLPLAHLELRSFSAVVLMLIAMQAINEVGMLALVRVRGQPARVSLSLFDTSTELTAGLIAVLVAIVWTRMELEIFLLLLAVLVAGMLALKRFAEMRLKLERLVAERTEALHGKTLQLERLVALDTLTGLYNRRHADEVLHREMEQAIHHGRDFCIALADIDHFKQINDGHSHAVGDRVLERVAQIFTQLMRASGLVARYGGEEFLFCFIGSDSTEASQLCEELRLAVEREPWTTLSPGLRVTMSVGLAPRQQEQQAAALLHHADACLYRAKHQGRNRVVVRA